LIAFILSAIFLITLFTTPLAETDSLIETAFYAQVLVISVISFFFLVYHTLIAASVNKEFRMHEAELSLHVPRIESKIAELSMFGDDDVEGDKVLKRLQLCHSAVTQAIASVKSSDSVNGLAVKHILPITQPHPYSHILILTVPVMSCDCHTDIRN
jgi:hypothetical protein